MIAAAIRDAAACSARTTLEGIQKRIGLWLKRWFETEDRLPAIGTLAWGLGRTTDETATAVRHMYAARRINASENPLGVRGGPMPPHACLVQVALSPKTAAAMNLHIANTPGVTRTNFIERAAIRELVWRKAAKTSQPL